jgi:hypothetical protein
VQESAVEPVGNNKSAAVTLLPQPAHELLQHVGPEEGGHEEPPAECCICLETRDDADGLVQLRCRHVFHSGCLERWVGGCGAAATAAPSCAPIATLDENDNNPYSQVVPSVFPFSKVSSVADVVTGC